MAWTAEGTRATPKGAVALACGAVVLAIISGCASSSGSRPAARASPTAQPRSYFDPHDYATPAELTISRAAADAPEPRYTRDRLIVDWDKTTGGVRGRLNTVDLVAVRDPLYSPTGTAFTSARAWLVVVTGVTELPHVADSTCLSNASTRCPTAAPSTVVDRFYVIDADTGAILLSTGTRN